MLVLIRPRGFSLVFSLGCMLAVAAAAPHARAADDPMLQCIAASDKGLDLRKQGKLIEARRVLATCATATCGAAISGVCERRLADTGAAVPSIVFLPKDGAGNDVAGVRVSMDGAPVGEPLAGRPLSVDPGPHTFKFEVVGQPPVERQFVLVEGVRDRQERIVFGPAPSAVKAASMPPDSAPPPGNGQRIVGLLIAATGVVALGVGGSVAVSAKSSYDGAAGCSGRVCESQQGIDARNSAIGTGNVATAIFIAGAAAAAGGGIIWLTAPRASKSDAATNSDFALGVAAGTLVLGGRF
jgi:hypothetical protein